MIYLNLQKFTITEIQYSRPTKPCILLMYDKNELIYN